MVSRSIKNVNVTQFSRASPDHNHASGPLAYCYYNETWKAPLATRRESYASSKPAEWPIRLGQIFFYV